MKKIAVVGLFLLPVLAWSQEELGDEVKSVEIRVVEDYKAQVRAAHKISEQPSFADTTSEKLAVNVRIQPKGMIIDFDPDPIPSIQLGRVKLPKLPTQKVSLGAGNYTGTYASFVLSSPRSKKNVWGIKAVHDGTLGGVNSPFYTQPTYENTLLADFQRATKNWNFKTQALIGANYRSFFGALDTNQLDTVSGAWQQRYGMNQQWLRTSNRTSKVLATYRSGGLSYLYTHAGFSTSEHLARTAHTVELTAGDQEIILDLGYQFSQYNGWSASGGQYHNFTVAPITRGKNGILTYEFGLDFTGTQTAGLAQDRFEFYVFPKVNLQAEILRRTLAIYGGWDGSSKQQTLQGLLKEVPQISLNQELRLSGQNRGYVGMQGALIGKVQYRLEGAMTFMNDAVQFMRDTLLSPVDMNGVYLPALSVGYAQQVLKTSFRGELNLPLKQFTASTYAQFNAYSGDAYFGSEGQVVGGLLSYEINDLRVTAAAKHVNGRYMGSAPELVLEAYTDVNLQLGYEINENLSISLRAYNLLNQDYQTHLGYRVRGTRGLFVLNYQF
ncbi:MAG: TonB-dependent receptor [Schleiferiaceae bacterium]|nr:TonB-dependent receptor [Schleiferiaceae bacterium]